MERDPKTFAPSKPLVKNAQNKSIATTSKKRRRTKPDNISTSTTSTSSISSSSTSATASSSSSVKGNFFPYASSIPIVTSSLPSESLLDMEEKILDDALSTLLESDRSSRIAKKVLSQSWEEISDSNSYDDFWEEMVGDRQYDRDTDDVIDVIASDMGDEYDNLSSRRLKLLSQQILDKKIISNTEEMHNNLKKLNSKITSTLSIGELKSMATRAFIYFSKATDGVSVKSQIKEMFANIHKINSTVLAELLDDKRDELKTANKKLLYIGENEGDEKEIVSETIENFENDRDDIISHMEILKEVINDISANNIPSSPSKRQKTTVSSAATTSVLTTAATVPTQTTSMSVAKTVSPEEAAAQSADQANEMNALSNVLSLDASRNSHNSFSLSSMTDDTIISVDNIGRPIPDVAAPVSIALTAPTITENEREILSVSDDSIATTEVSPRQYPEEKQANPENTNHIVLTNNAAALPANDSTVSTTAALQQQLTAVPASTSVSTATTTTATPLSTHVSTAAVPVNIATLVPSSLMQNTSLLLSNLLLNWLLSPASHSSQNTAAASIYPPPPGGNFQHP